jgi:hypothetical protein
MGKEGKRMLKRILLFLMVMIFVISLSSVAMANEKRAVVDLDEWLVYVSPVAKANANAISRAADNPIEVAGR